MPPLTEESDQVTSAVHQCRTRSLSARSAHPPLSRAASLAPRPWHEPHDSTPTEPQARRMLDEPMALDLHHLKRPPISLSHVFSRCVQEDE